jgi:hypothetical protein
MPLPLSFFCVKTDSNAEKSLAKTEETEHTNDTNESEPQSMDNGHCNDFKPKVAPNIYKPLGTGNRPVPYPPSRGSPPCDRKCSAQEARNYSDCKNATGQKLENKMVQVRARLKRD